MADAPTLLLIDTPGFIFRAYHALPALSTARGVSTGAVLGFCNMLFRLLEDYQPSHLAAVFDTGRPSFRAEIYGEYKANRPPVPEDLAPQFALIKHIVDAFRIPRLSLAGYEADDVIATLVGLGLDQGMRVLVVSSDKDLMQLASDRVQLLDTMKERTFGPAEVQDKFGVSPAQLADWLALVGDSSDNVPGVPGIGAKTAAKLLQEYNDLEGVLAAASELRGRARQNLLEYAEQARLSRKLVTLVTDCPISHSLADLRRIDPDRAELWKVFGELEFSRLRPRVAPGEVLDRSGYATVLGAAALDRVCRQIRQAGELAGDLETTSLDPMRADIVGFALCWGEGQACYVPVGHRYLGAPPQLSCAEVADRLRPLLADAALRKFGQNHKYDRVVLARHALPLEGVVGDPMLASYVLDPSRNSHGLDELARVHLGHEMLKYKAVAGREADFDFVEVERATEYAGEDAEATYRLSKQLGAALEDDTELAQMFRQVELPLCRVLADMEQRGCCLDVGKLSRLQREVEQQLADLLTAIQQQAGWEINPNSPKQLQKLLFEQLGLSTGRKIKTGFSTDSTVLSDLAIEHPIAASIEEWRTLAKLKNGYIDSLPLLVNPQTQRVHTSYNQAVAATGRLSSSDPNLQNIPIRTELGRRIREAFVAPPGRLLLSADYSQIELRVLAHLSQDPVLIDAFDKRQDVHQRTAAEVFGIAAEQVSAEQRRVAKAVNFGVIYGQTDWGLARQLRIPRHVASRYIADYFSRYAGVEAFMERTIADARRTRMVRTLLGRRRPLPDIQAQRRPARQYAERIARNTPIQGTAADLIKLAMIRVEQALTQARLDAPMILTVHDELVFEVLPVQQAEVAEIVRQTMATVAELSVTLEVEVAAGHDWAEAH